MEGLQITVCKFKEAVLMVREEKEENSVKLYFENPVTGKWHSEIEKVFKGWIEEQSEEEIEEWNTLKKFIENDGNLSDKINSGIEFIDYEEFN